MTALVWCVQYFDRVTGKKGLCALAKQPRDGHKPKYRDAVPTKCHHTVMLTSGFAFSEPTCQACKAAPDP